MLGEKNLMHDIHKFIAWGELCARSSLIRMSALGVDGGGAVLPS